MIAGKTSAQAIPKTKKSKYSDDRPITTPTAMSPGETSECRTPLSAPGTPDGAAPFAVGLNPVIALVVVRIEGAIGSHLKGRRAIGQNVHSRFWSVRLRVWPSQK